MGSHHGHHHQLPHLPPLRRGRLLRTLTVLLCAGALTAAAPPAEALGATPASSGDGAACVRGTGPYQRQLERFLKRPVDGRQSPGDCVAIRDFQREQRLGRRDGYARLETYRQTQVVKATGNPNAAGRCPTHRGRVVCVDMTRQLLWVQTGRRVDHGPVATRTGRWGEETRRGLHRIQRRVRDDHSRLFDNAPMPFAQYFDGGQAIHGRYDDLFDGGGSAGCVNLRLRDAKVLWRRLGVGDLVFVWGRKPGT
ncbi:murein L,D-transpeptidase [Streptomyces sp. AJS327]|uniref:L,D-transpeptidase n=1 Tax=Streptomyces sp. AJS327 TaxID=2545265 RepID=UPI0015DE3B08|nr:L,D-transpeptidase [Streptomyces sp. AJS327]MBA0049893.1 murein L,D-transpeptidase [Streptomyces sp. AJS327]